MNRTIVSLAAAGAIIVGLSIPVLAQAPQPTDPNTAPRTSAQPSATTPPPAATHGGVRSPKKAQRMAARGDCRAQGKQQALSHDALRNFVKSCMAAH